MVRWQKDTMVMSMYHSKDCQQKEAMKQKCKRCGQKNFYIVFTRWGMICIRCNYDTETTDSVSEEKKEFKETDEKNIY